jgi:RNA-binding protein
MLTGKQRRYLRSLANNLKSAIQIGKEGISKNLISEIDQNLTSNEIAKVSVNDVERIEVRALAEKLAKDLKAELVQIIGFRLVFFRRNKDKPRIELPK